MRFTVTRQSSCWLQEIIVTAFLSHKCNKLFEFHFWTQRFSCKISFNNSICLYFRAWLLHKTWKLNPLSAHVVKTLTRLLSLHQYAYENEILPWQAVEAVNKIRNKYPPPTEPRAFCSCLTVYEGQRGKNTATQCWWRTVIVPTASREVVIDSAIGAQWVKVHNLVENITFCSDIFGRRNKHWLFIKKNRF